MNGTNNRSPDELERDIERTRADIDRTLTSLQDRISPAAVLDRAMRTTRDGSGEFAAGLGRTVQNNPVPLALLGVSLAWLMISGRNRDETRRVATPVQSWREDPSRPSTVHPATTAGDDGSAGSALRDKAAEVGASAAEIRDKVGAAAADVRDKVEAAASGTYRKAEEGVEHIRNRTADEVDQIHRRAIDVSGRTAVRAENAFHDAQEFAREHPLVIGALAVAVGAGLAALLPTTRRENELLGEKSDSIKDATRDAATEQMEKAKRTGQAAAQEARAEAERQGLTPEQLRKDLDDKAQAASKVAGAAVKAAENEVRRDTSAKPHSPTSPLSPAGSSAETQPLSSPEPGASRDEIP